MNWMDWVVVGLFSLDIVASVLIIGKDRKPLTPGGVVFGGIVNALIIIGLIATH